MKEPYVYFKLKQEHITLMENLNFGSNVVLESDYIEYKPEINQKRPFGNSGMTYDAMSILGLVDDNGEYLHEDEKKVKMLLIELPVALEIVMQNQTFIPGDYKVNRYGAYFAYRGRRNLLFWEDVLIGAKDMELGLDRLVTLCMNSIGDTPYEFIKEMETFKDNTEIVEIIGRCRKYAVDEWRGRHSEAECHRYMPGGDRYNTESACNAEFDTEALLEDLLDGKES